MYLGIVVTSHSPSFLTSTILARMGYIALSARVMIIPIFVTAAVISVATDLLADRLQHRFGSAIFGCANTTVRYAILLSMARVRVGVRYFALFIITSGAYITQAIAIVWLSNDLAGLYKRRHRGGQHLPACPGAHIHSRLRGQSGLRVARRRELHGVPVRARPGEPHARPRREGLGLRSRARSPRIWWMPTRLFGSLTE